MAASQGWPQRTRLERTCPLGATGAPAWPLPILARDDGSGQGAAARLVDGGLLARHRALAGARSRAGGRGALLLRHRRRDQRVRGRVPDPEHGSRARGRRGPVRRLRAGVQRAARAGRAQARVAGRVEPALADAASPSGRSPRSSSSSAPWVMAAFGYGSLAAGLARVLFPIVVLLGLFGIVVGILNSYDHFSSSGADAGVLERRDHRRARHRRPARRRHGREALRLRGLDRHQRRSSSCCCRCRGSAGRDDRLHVVIDWRDPMVRRTFVLMLPDHDRRSA